MIAHSAYAAEDDRSVLIRTPRGKEMEVMCSSQQYLAGLEAYRNGTMMQDAFPFLTSEEREFLISGTTPEEWRRLFLREQS